MKAWLYSVGSSGKLRASWSITEADLKPYISREQSGSVQCEEELVELLAKIDEPEEPNATLLAELYPLALSLAASSDAWQAITSDYWQQGIQIILVDSPLPQGHKLFLTFTFPNEQPLSKEQLVILVERVLTGQGGCCTE